MKTYSYSTQIWLLTIVFLSLLSFCCTANTNFKLQNRDRLFNSGWKFMRDSLEGAENPEYDDSEWIVVDLPHDWSIADLPGDDTPGKIGPFSKKSPGEGRSNGHVLGGTGWYRKHFTTNKTDMGKKVILRFDGVYMETEVWVNGKTLGIHKYGYTPFWFDITSFLNHAGESNVIAVKVDNIGRNTRWYTGSGIYRNVSLTFVNPLHIAVWGVKLITPKITETSAPVDFYITVQNDGEKSCNVLVEVKVKDKSGQVVGQTVKNTELDSNRKNIVTGQVIVSDPALWSVESPNMYYADISIKSNRQVMDQYIQPFGIRSIEFSAEKGFLLNGNPMELKGGSMHHDNGLLGSAAIARAEERRVEIMKANGYNAIRCSHNPPSEVFLNACDKLGILVINEFSDIWEMPKNPQDYSRFFREWWKQDLADMVMRDRNHPCIILWSIGNEILEKNDTSGLRIGKQLADAFKELDNTRLTTEAVNDNWMRRGKEWDSTGAAFSLLGVCGYNYEWGHYESDHKKYPDRIIFGSESFPLEAFEYWKEVLDHPYVIGDFVWTGMDYLGETAIGRSQYVPAGQEKESVKGMATVDGIPSGDITPDMAAMAAMFSQPTWPWFGAWCGDIDITGDRKPQKLYRDVLWNISKIEINVHAPIPEGKVEQVSLWGWPDEWPSWNWKGNEGKPLQVRVFTKADKVRLELNGKVIGEKEVSVDTKYVASFEVPYQPGELKAIALKNNQEFAIKSLKTTSNAVAIRLIADRNIIKADRNDLAFITIEAVDTNGLVVPDAAILIKLSLTGSGELVASGNACPYDMESVNKSMIKTFHGKAQAIIRPYTNPGKIYLMAETNDGTEAELEIKTQLE